MNKFTGHGGHCVNKVAQDRGKVNKVRCPGLNHSDRLTRRYRSSGSIGQV